MWLGFQCPRVWFLNRGQQKIGRSGQRDCAWLQSSTFRPTCVSVFSAVPCPSALRYLTVLRIGIHDADVDHDRFPAFHFDGVAKPYFAGSSLILSAPFATGITQIGVATSAELRSDV